MNEITPEMIKVLQESVARETEFFKRHGIEHEESTRITGYATPAHLAWVSAVELECKHREGDGRVFLDTPLGRKAFILGFNQPTPPRSGTPRPRRQRGRRMSDEIVDVRKSDIYDWKAEIEHYQKENLKLMSRNKAQELEIANLREFVHECSMKPYADSDPISLLSWIRSRAKVLDTAHAKDGGETWNGEPPVRGE